MKKSGSGFALLFGACSLWVIEQEMLVNKVGNLIREYPNGKRTIFNYPLYLA